MWPNLMLRYSHPYLQVLNVRLLLPQLNLLYEEQTKLPQKLRTLSRSTARLALSNLATTQSTTQCSQTSGRINTSSRIKIQIYSICFTVSFRSVVVLVSVKARRIELIKVVYLSWLSKRCVYELSRIMIPTWFLLLWYQMSTNNHSLYLLVHKWSIIRKERIESVSWILTRNNY